MSIEIEPAPAQNIQWRTPATPEYIEDLKSLVRHTRKTIAMSYQHTPSDIEDAFQKILDSIGTASAYLFLPPRPAGTKTCQSCLRPY